MSHIRDFANDTVLAPQPSRHLVIFVHGIFSNHGTFASLNNGLLSDTRLSGYTYAYFDYDFHDGIRNNADRLATALRSTCDITEYVVLVCHSMGGLVSRLAILTQQLLMVKTVILLATPNWGAFRTAQLGTLMQLVRGATRGVYAIFSRKTGVLDLTRVYEIMEPEIKSHSRHADAIRYITIPATFFHEARGTLSVQLDRWRKLFETLMLSGEAVRALLPILSFNMTVPHDGIVEETSNSLLPVGPGRWSEKAASITGNPSTPPTYAHINLPACDELNHVTIHNHPDVIHAVAEVILCNNLSNLQLQLGPSKVTCR